MQEILIDAYTAGGRLDKLLKKYLDKASSGFIYKMLRKKNIVLNDAKASGSELLQSGDVVKLYLSEETIARFHTTQQKQSPGDSYRDWILYEDENLIALKKPAGMLSQKVHPRDHSMNDILTAYLGSSDLFKPGISNRLDRNTSGIILAGKNPVAVRCLNESIRDRSLVKLYLCIVKGDVKDNAKIEGYLRKDSAGNTVQIRREIREEEKEQYSFIQTAYQVLSRTNGLSLLLVDLITGRSHQIRAHLSSIGHPIIGDTKYGDSAWNQRFRQKYGLKYQLLHACRVEFRSMSGILEYMNGKEISCEIPDLFQRIMKEESLCLHGAPGAFEAPNLKQ